MTRSLLAVPLAASVLLSCSTAPKVDPLEAKAREGDPVAACQLAARSLHDCALARQAWDASNNGPRPACMSEPVSEQQMSYLDKARDKMRATDQLLFLTGPRIQLLAAHAILISGPADKAVQAAVEVQRDCSKFADSMVD
jgi:hypothetical protein